MSKKEKHMFDVPNLDDFSLNADDFDIASSVLYQCSLFCQLRAKAIRCREVGGMETAIQYEKRCNNIYNNLPKWAKW